MPRSFDVVTESPASVEQILAAFRREDYWSARLEGGTDTLDSLTVAFDGAVDVRIVQRVRRQGLSGLVAKAVPGDMTVVYHERWSPPENGRARGEVDVTVSGGLGSSRADNRLEPSGTGTRMRSKVKVHARIPLLGGQLEKTIGDSLVENIPAVLDFTSAWIAEHDRPSGVPG
jgi:hypothetical protein